MKHSKTKITLGTIAAGVMIASCPLAQAQTVIFADNYNVANGNLDPASLSGRTSGLDSGSVLPQSGGIEQTISGNQLRLSWPASFQAGEMRFDTIGSPSTLFDWSTGAGGLAMTSAGGMTISFLWTAADVTSGNWLYFTAGSSTADISGTHGLRVLNANTASGIIFENNGTVQAFNNGSGVVNLANAFATTSVNHAVTLNYSFNSFAVGAAVTLNAYVDGFSVATNSFTWTQTGQYMDLGSYQENNLVDNFSVTTLTPIPEPTSMALLGASGLLVFARRFFQSKA